MNLQAFLPFFKTKYGEDLKGKPDREAILEKRMDRCGNLCQLGIANLFWKGTTQVFKELKDKQDPHLIYHIVMFTICLLCMTMGTVAAMFPETAPFPCFMTGLGALMAIISMFGSYHLDLLAFFPSASDCCTSMALTSAAFTLYWAYAVQDPWIIHLLARLTTAVWALVFWMWNKGGRMGETWINKLMNLQAWNAISFLFKTKYEEDLEGNPERDTILEKRMDRCGNLCQLGIANLFWKGTTLVFKEMKDKQDPNLLQNIVIFTICLLLMTMGTVATMFPETAPFPCFTAGLGALMAIMSMFASYHLDLLAYFSSSGQCYISMALISATFTIYWAYAVQDPWIIHLLARMTMALWDLISWMYSKVVENRSTLKMTDFFGSWKRKGKKQDPALAALLGRNK